MDNLLATWPYNTLKRWTPKKTALSVSVAFGDSTKLFAFSCEDPGAVSSQILNFCSKLATGKRRGSTASTASSGLGSPRGMSSPRSIIEEEGDAIPRRRPSLGLDRGGGAGGIPSANIGDTIGGVWRKMQDDMS